MKATALHQAVIDVETQDWTDNDVGAVGWYFLFSLFLSL